MKKLRIFVLGAGLSQEIGFPSGAELISNLSQLIAGDRVDVHPSRDPEFKHKYFNLMNSGFESIDQGLRTKEFSPLKADVMARASLLLLTRESKSLLQPFSDDKNIGGKCFQNSSYRKLFQIWKQETDRGNGVIFINFNYDRNLETYFHYTEASRRHLLTPNGQLLREGEIYWDPEPAQAFYKFMKEKFVVYHPYGRLGPSEYEVDGTHVQEAHSSKYGSMFNENVLNFITTAREINTIEREDGERHFKMKGMLSEFENGKKFGVINDRVQADPGNISGAGGSGHEMYFLGFAYAEGNLRRIGVENIGNGVSALLDAQEITRIGTGYGLATEYREELEKNYRIKAYDQTIFDFLRSQFGV